MNELKPCPFCGGNGKVHLDEGCWFVACTECHSGTTVYFNEDEAIDVWNSRI